MALKNNDDVLGSVSQPLLGNAYAHQHYKRQRQAADARQFVSYYEKLDADAKRDEEPKPKPGREGNSDLFGPVQAPEVRIQTPTLVERDRAAEQSKTEQQRQSRNARLHGLGLGKQRSEADIEKAKAELAVDWFEKE